MVGSTAVRGRLSVWPPESASNVMSSATATCAPSSASETDRAPRLTSADTISRGAGDMKNCAVSARESFAKRRFGRWMDPSGRSGQPLVRVPDHGWRQPHESRRRHPPHASCEVEVDERLLDGRIVGRMNQVGPPGGPSALELALDAGDVLLDVRRRQASGTEEGEHLGACERDDQRPARDAVRHRPGHVGEPDPVGLQELLRTEPLGVHGRQRREQPVRGLERPGAVFVEGCADLPCPAISQDVNALAKAGRGGNQRAGREIDLRARDLAAVVPPPENVTLCRCGLCHSARDRRERGVFSLEVCHCETTPVQRGAVRHPRHRGMPGS